MDKRGKIKTGGVIAIIATIAVVLSVMVYLFGFYLPSQSIAGTGAKNVPATNCGVTTTLSPTITDALNGAASVSPSFSAMISQASGQPFGANQSLTSSTALNQYNRVQLLGVASGYFTTLLASSTNPIIVSQCGPNYFTGSMYAYAAPSLTILTSPGNVAVTNASAGGAQNLTAPTAGGTLNFGLQLTGTNYKSPGDIEVIVEVNSSVSSMTLNGVQGITTKPATYANQVSTNPQTFVFNFPASSLLGSTTGAYNVVWNGAAVMKSSQVYVGPMYISVWGKQAFLDSTGQYNYGVETTDGNTNKAAYQNVEVGYIHA